ncbi:MAG TPA: demethoxyubiquinone hydroxylase family protein [Bacillota bacterium]|mgnify:CR=1 FL=1|nr:demethoxyubiquinone hydroxylase family protein [Bacillota bacterium]
MTGTDFELKKSGNYDTSIIRTQVRIEDIRVRGQGMSPARLKAIRKGLLTLHTLELMAVNIYKFQIAGKSGELNRHLIAAMSNEMTHYQDFQVKLFEYGFRPGLFRWMFWIAGFVFGTLSRLLGAGKILKTGIWVETKAVEHYGKLLQTVEWDDDTRKVIEKNQTDEFGHIMRWKKLLQEGGGR